MSNTVTTKTAELTGAALDWAVAKCEGVNDEAFRLYYEPTEPTDYDSHGYPEFHYSTVWAQGGPIIERERIHLRPNQSDNRHKAFVIRRPYGLAHRHEGPTPLIAAMRCYVASTLGDTVEVPAELTNN